MTIDGWLARAGLAVGVLGIVLVPAGCSMTDPDPDDPVPEETTPGKRGPTTPIPEDPTLTAKPPGGSQRVTGVVERSPEDRCLTLAAPGRTWVLTGAVAGLEAGDRVTVKGRPDPDATTTCQQGPVLVVVEVERG
ncbi:MULTISPECIES: hypothetical protein [unclassified Aeromicrobium]|uniref:hypothetical protein n=1 Tax=unclassified Aeromicrobium TaxID=2633570 RepID=UPI0006F5E98E|nr:MULTISPECIES: hypothetical protein [unclassified Aeromicrobium]KQO38580.1 hypothetical protein ASF05_01300 [Aeromicrobium sp. Leaf245]KQP25345.1 hypothetical protein ASF38_12630 [Aeromicrobium sp. Leaf272]KQP81828.1 hypothetical protein ASF35_10045 [Aeromicrobium sp. Leaf291]